MSRLPAITRLCDQATGYADALARHLLMVSLPGADAGLVREHLAKAFEALGGLKSVMDEIEALAPVSAEAGYERGAILREGLKL